METIDRGTRGVVNWDAIKKQYITGRYSCRELAAMHGVAMNTIEKHCARDGWVQARKDAQAADTEKVRDKVAATAANALCGLYEQYTRIVEIAATQQRHMIECPEQYRPADVLTVARTLDILIGIYRDLFDAPSQDVAFDQQLSRDRLDLERDKFALVKDKLPPGSDHVINITIAGVDDDGSKYAG